MTSPSTLTPCVSLRQASVRAGAHTLLHPLDFTVHRGERVVLVGANGAGKTTLLRLLNGRVSHSGERSVSAQGPGTTAMVFQRPFVLRCSVWRNVWLALWLARVPASARAQRVQAALERVRLWALKDRPARALSGGQQQRLALARAWAVQPQVLFLDEPTASLDPGAKREVEALLGSFGQEGLTWVMSSHNLGQAKRLATRVVHLHQGQVVHDRPVAEFFAGPLPSLTAQFLSGEWA